jgi:putative nucleotidyltransferase with HDIG domain
VAAGDLQVRVEPSGNDEVSSLTHRFNQMVSNLFRSQMDLIAAYDSTLEGWIKMLDLRDRETMGHSKRVTDLTIELARRFKVPADQMDYIRRGALLHDIGKMAVPDAILLKEGPLTTEEWKVMRQHPVYAMQMLQEIPFLRPSIEIPYCHHEHWNGSGYPRGLRGDAIPLVARIFTVVDSWDALCSERPYRKALTPEQARAIIHQDTGTRLDPEIVLAFLVLLDENGHKV